MSSIFIQIAAYRDSELKKTLKDCLAKAKWPENLIFSIAWQHSKEDVWDNLDEYKNDPRFKIIDIDFMKSNGVCWARNLLQQQYAGEDYTLQLDSHHRFVQGWDEYLIDTHNLLKRKGFKKPLITGYIPGYDPVTDTYINPGEVWTLAFNRFSPEGMLHLNPNTEPNPEQIHMPIRARLYSAHFAFAAGEFVKEVPHDPNMFFHGEEPSIAIRAWTHGYDLFHPHRCFVYHFYERPGYRRHWDDQGHRHKELNDRAHDRFRKMLGIGCDVEDLGEYGLGKERSLQAYEKFAGIRFKDRRIQKYTLKNYPPPNPYQVDYDESFLGFYKHCIDIGYHLVPEKDYDFWVVAFLDKNGEDIERHDAPEREVNQMLNDKDRYAKVWREFFYDREPVRWRVWPHSRSKGYGHTRDGVFTTDPIEGDIEFKGSGPANLPKEEEKPAPREDMKALYLKSRETPYPDVPGIATLDDVEEKLWMDTASETILVHLPAYREPELIPTILDALAHATFPERIHFGICRQYNPDDGFDNLDDFRKDPRFKIYDVHYKSTKGLPWARGIINDTLLTDETYVLQLDAHHRFVKNWDAILIAAHNKLEETHEKPIITGYTPEYNPFNDPAGRVVIPWMSGFRCFYPKGTIFIGPQELTGWQGMKAPVPARFLCGHFDFARAQWARDVRHDPSIYFAGEEINLTVRSFTHGYDFFHMHRLTLWHGTMRLERSQICKWDDDNKERINWPAKQDDNRRMIMKLFGVEEHPDIELLPGYGLGTERTVADYEKYAGLNFKERQVQKYTEENRFPPVPQLLPPDLGKWLHSFHYEVNIKKSDFPRNDYKTILVAFDDEKKEGIHSKYVDPVFINGVIHFTEHFVHDPSRDVVNVVYWGVDKSGEWRECISNPMPEKPVKEIPGNPYIQNVSKQDIIDGIHMNPGEDAVLIQILDPGEEFPKPDFNFQEKYQFSFCDDYTTQGIPAWEEVLISQKQAKEISEVLKSAFDRKLNVIVHCLVGGRSAAVAKAAIDIGFNLAKNNKDNRPNQRVLHMVKEQLLELII